MKQIVTLILLTWAAIAQQNKDTTSALKSHLILAKKIYERTTGVKISLKDPILEQMAKEIKDNKFIEAAKIATNTSAFTNVRARNFALRLSNKSNSVVTEFNDMAALIVGIIRDDQDFREIMTSRQQYQLNTATFYKNNLELMTRNPLADADERLLDLHTGLEKINTPPAIGLAVNEGKVVTIKASTSSQLEKNIKISEEGMSSRELPDPAGVLTTNFFARSQYSGGSNRRGIEFVVKNFLCSSMPEIGNPNASDAYVGRDVDRFVGGSNQNYVNNCKSCHTVMDAMRGAFAKVDYATFSQDMATNTSGLAYGGFAGTLKNEKAVWLDIVFNQSPLEQELISKGALSKLVTNTEKIYNLDYSLAIKSNYPPETATTYAEKKRKEITTMNNALLLKDTQGVPTPNITYVKKAQQFNRVLYALNQRDVLSELAKRTTLKSQILINPELAYSSSNVKPEWLAIKNHLHFFILTADYSLGAARDELFNVKKLIYYDIFANKNLSSNITIYNQLCLDKWDQSKIDSQLTESAKNAQRAAMTKAFLFCDLEFRKNTSFIGQFIIEKMTANGASIELKKGVEDLILSSHITLYNNGTRARADGWKKYLQTQNQLISFGGFNFNTDTGVANKLNSGSYTYGAEVKDDTFVNLASASYGWRGPYKDGGKGLNQFGHMIADSNAFSSCMTRKVFQSVCYKDLNQDPKLLKKWTQKFEVNYKFKNLIAEIVTNPDCGLIKKQEKAK